jgi:flagellar biosynthesis/type III secretory pathway protein FliH
MLRPVPGAPEELAPCTPASALDDTAYDDTPADVELELARDVRLFRARVMEAVDAAVEPLLAGIAADVLARELVLAPADVEAIVDRALARCSSEGPLRVRVHPNDAASVRSGIPVAGDEHLQRGDAIVDLRCGSIDASIAIRLAALLRDLS